MCFEYDGHLGFFHDRVVVARKPHRCSECHTTIAARERYHYHTGQYDGDFFAEKVCRRCDFDRVRVVEHELAEGCEWHEAWPHLGELVSHLRDSGMGQTLPEDVPDTFQVGDEPKRPVAA